MATNTNVDYNAEKGGYYKVLLGLLVLTAVTFIQPSMFLTEHNFSVQLLIGFAKAWLILMYYMHLKGEKLIGYTVLFTVLIVVYFFVIVILDIQKFQFKEESHIVKAKHEVVDQKKQAADMFLEEQHKKSGASEAHGSH